MRRYARVIRIFGLILMVFSTTMLIPVGVAWLFADGGQASFDDAMLVTVAAGAALWLLGRSSRGELQIKDGFLLVVLTWTVLPVFAALPLLIFFWPRMSFTDAYFEAVSGLTTTGATVLSGLDALPLSINLWRAELVWLGGMGLIVLAVAILPLLGVGGRHIFRTEAPGPMKDTKLTPRMAETAKWLWLVYAAISMLCVFSLRWAGMTWSDAVIHAFTVMGLGGFSSHDLSFAYWNSPRIEFVTIVFMMIAGMNFATHFMAWRSRSWSAYRSDPEARWFVLVLVASVFGIALYLYGAGTYDNFGTALRVSAFNVVSIATTTGYASVDFGQWPIFAPLWMLFLSSFATCSGSTGGGIKMMRAIILYKQVFRELIRAIHPNAVYPIKFGTDPVAPNIIFAVLAFGFMYMVVLVSLTLALSFSGLDIVTAFSAVVACVNNTGPGLNLVGPSTTFAVLTDFQTWVCSVGMLLGRLEIFTLLVVLVPAFWRK